MAQNSTPIFKGTPVIGAATISVANAARDGTGTVVTVVSAGASGTRIDYVRVKAIVTTTAGMVRLFVHDGASFFLWHELSISAITPSATVKTAEVELVPTSPLDLPSGYSLRASTHNAEEMKIFAHGGQLG